MNNNYLLNYLDENFQGLKLESPLFYNARIGIRFELGVPYRGIEHPNYFSNVLIRSTMLFEEMFSEKDELIVVVKSYKSVPPYICFNEGEKVFPKYLKEKRLKDEINCEDIEKHFDEDKGDLTGISYQYILKCKRDNIDYKGILKAKSHQDFAKSPYISDGVFFINSNKNVIFYMYDDRGVDIVSNAKESLLGIYKKYNTWILDYDRERIDNVFLNA